MKKYIHYLALVIFILSIQGCIATKSYDFRPTLEQMSSVNPSRQLDYTITSSNIKIALESNIKRGDIDALPLVYINNFKVELDNAIVESGLFNLNSQNELSIKVIIYKVDTPIVSATFPAQMTALYTLIKQNDVIFEKEITTNANTEMSYSFFGGTRQMESINRVTKKNIIAFLNSAKDELK